MAILKILQYPDLRLRRKAYSVADVASKEVQKIIDDMLETLANTAQCAGLAATQLDIDPAPAISVINAPNEFDTPLCLINPQILSGEGESSEEEGCMSIYPAQISAAVTRFTQVTIKALDRNGKEFTMTSDAFLAKVFQHEIDHLSGILYIDKLSRLKRSRLEKKIIKFIHP